jgi:hypothetical protein
MTEPSELLELHPVPHPNQAVRQAGFPLDHPYVEQCWTPALGPSSVLPLRRIPWLWRQATPATVSLDELGQQLGLGAGTGRTSHINRTIDRVTRFGFATLAAPGELHVYTEVRPLTPA